MTSSSWLPQMTARSIPRRSVALALVATASLSACSGITEFEPSVNRYGSVFIDGAGTSATAATALGSAVFFEAPSASVPNSASAILQGDNCEFQAIQNPPTGGGFSAGAALSLDIAGRSNSIPFDAPTARYVMAQRFAYTVGENITITVPGNASFPASSVTVKLAEPVLPGAVALPAAGSPLLVTWNGNNDATSAMFISVRYANPSTAAAANEQIFCSAKDDGSLEIPASALGGLRASPAALRSITLTRLRTNEALQSDNRTLLHVSTVVDTTRALP